MGQVTQKVEVKDGKLYIEIDMQSQNPVDLDTAHHNMINSKEVATKISRIIQCGELPGIDRWVQIFGTVSYQYFDKREDESPVIDVRQ